MTTIGFLGFGEVGHAFARGFMASADAPQVLAYDAAPSDSDGGRLVRSRAEDAGAQVCDDVADLVRRSDLVLAAVPSFAAVQAARGATPLLRAGQGYYDLTASHPDTKRELAALVAGVPGVAFADLAIVGPVRVLGHRVPILASGAVSDEHLDLLRGLEMDIDVVSEQPGDASAIKLCRSVFTKGIEALLVETLMVAQRMEVADTVLASIGRTLSSQPFEQAANRYVTGNAVHAARRVHEIEDVVAMLESAGVDPLVTRGTLARMQRSAASGARERFGGEPPEHYSAVIDLYTSVEKQGGTA